MAQKYIRSEYNGTVVLSNIRKGRASVPVFGMNETYTATKVNQWYDDSPMDDSKADGSVYLKLAETGEYFLVNLPNKGELFLEKDTMAQMRDLNSVEILLLKMGYYKGVGLSGYYVAGDTPGRIEYYLSETSASDDGGSVIAVGGIKLEHDFKEDFNSVYFGDKFNLTFDGYKEIAPFNSTEGRLERLPNGNIIFVYRRSIVGYHNNNAGNIYYKITTNEGETWGEEQVIVDTEYDARNFIIGITGSNISIIYRLINVDSSGNITHIGVYYKYSTNNGLTWSPQIELNRGGAASVVPFGKFLKRGNTDTFLMYAQANPNSTCHLFHSIDNGITWSLGETIYSMDSGVRITEPIIVDVDSGSLLFVRNADNSISYSSIMMGTSENGINFTSPAATNILGNIPYADTPVWVDYLGDGYIAVYANSRQGTINDINLSRNFIIYKNKVSDIFSNPLGFKEYHNVVRPYINRASIYGYPATVKTSYGYLGCLTERRRVDNQINSLSFAYANEADNIYQFKMIEKNYQNKYTTLGKKQFKHNLSGASSFITNVNDSIGDEINLYNKQWMLDVDDPLNSGVKSSSGRMVSLHSINRPGVTNYPQVGDGFGGMVILAQTSTNGAKWLIGRGASNDDQGTLFINTYSTTTSSWSGWRKILTEGLQAPFISTSATQVNWSDVDKTKAQFVSASLDGAPPGGISTHGAFFPQGTTGQFGTKVAFRNGKIWIRSTENGVEGGWIEVATLNSSATTTVKGLVNQSAKVDNVSTTPPSPLSVQTVTTIEEAQTAINNLVTMVNAMQANEVELKAKLNAKLSADRASGQQSTT